MASAVALLALASSTIKYSPVPLINLLPKPKEICISKDAVQELSQTLKKAREVDR